MKTHLLALILTLGVYLPAAAQMHYPGAFNSCCTVNCHAHQHPVYKPIRRHPIRQVVAVPVYPGAYAPLYLNPEQFSRVLHHISSRHFESDRYRVAQQVSASNSLSSEQVAQVMQLFSFESTRLDFARFAYHRVADPQNYFLVNNAFRFSSSVDELYNYIMHS